MGHNGQRYEMCRQIRTNDETKNNSNNYFLGGKNMRIKSKKIPLYTGKLIIIQLEEKENMSDVAKKYNINYDVSNYDGMAFIENQNYIIAFGKNTSYSIVAHESLHAVSYIFDAHNMVMDCKNDESIAYLLEWIVEECHKFINGFQNRKSVGKK